MAIPNGDTNSSDNLLVLLGKGDGTFTQTALLGGGNDVAVADFNNDGFLDLVTAPAGNEPISIYLGNGDGTFQPRMFGPSALGFVYDLELGDLNHDGNMDLIASSGSTTNSQGYVASGFAFHTLLGRGDGTFDYTQSIDFYFLSHSSLLVADMNRDGKLDVVALDSANDVLRVLPGLGDGTFPRDVNRLPLTVNTALPAGAMLAAIADLNGDGKLDMAVTNTDHVSVLIGKGDGTFQPPIAYDAPAAYDVIAADYNGDGLLDLLVTNHGVSFGFANADRGNLYVLLNVGNGGFATALLVTGTATPLHPAAGDFDGDGRTDVFLTSESRFANVLLGEGDGSFLTAQRYQTGLTVDPNSGYRIEAARAADVNGDGFQDVILLGDTNFGTVGVRLGNGDGTFQTIRSFPLGLFSPPTEVVFGDVNHDGKVDLAVASFVGETNVSILLGNGDGTFQPRVILNAVPLDIALTDMNHDGKLDLVLGVAPSGLQILLGNGDGTFQNPIAVPLPGLSFQIEVRDFNGDGNLDLAALQPGLVTNASQDDSHIYIVLNRGDGSFLPAASYSISPESRSMTSGDVNGDGVLDLITAANQTSVLFGPQAGIYGGSISVLLGAGDGRFQSPVRYGIFPHSYSDVVTADIDGDGHLEIIAAASFGGFVSNQSPSEGLAVLRNQGDGTFGDPTFYDHANVTISKIATADFNGDHLPDILAPSGADNTFSILFGVRLPQRVGATIADAAIAVTGANLHPRTGLTFTAVVGSFSDANSLSVPGDFTATIGWGDGQTTSGTVRANPFGGFDVIGTHGYAASANYVTTITVAEIGAGTHQGNGAATLIDAAITLAAQGVDLSAIQFFPFAGTVATFQSDNAANSAADFATTIDWGDGQSTPGYVFPQASSGFEVRGVHVYSAAGAFNVQVQINAIAGGATIAQSTATVEGRSAPVAHDDAYAVTRGGTLTAADSTGTATPGSSADDGVLVNDANGDGNTLTAILITGPSHAFSFTLNADGSFSYVHDGSGTTTDSFTYKVKDNTGADSNVATVTITVNAPPLATNDTATTNQNTAAVINVLGNDTDPDGTLDPTSVAIVAAASHGTTSVNPTTGAVTYTPAANYTGPDSFTYKIKDNRGADSNVATVAITINAPPLATNDSTITNQNTPILINVLGNDTDSDGTVDPASVAIVAPAGHGTASINPTTGVITYTPALNYTGPDSFTYKVKDNTGADSNVATVTITVNAPPLASNDAATTNQNTPILINVLGNDTDSDGTLDATSVAIIAAASHGTASVNPITGVITYTPAANYTGPDSFTYKVKDNRGADANVATVLITVNTPPVATNDTAGTNQNSAAVISVLTNDSDPDGTLDPTSVAIVSAVSHGTTSINPTTGAVTYTPAANYTGPDSFTYKIKDNRGADSNVATVAITVNAPAAGDQRLDHHKSEHADPDQRTGQRYRLGRHR